MNANTNKKCIFCLEEKPLTIEHVFPESIGGRLTIPFVCNDCNSKLGTAVDGKFQKVLPIELSRQTYGITGKKGHLPDVFSGDWIVEDFAEETIQKYRETLAGKKVLLALSGGVDSSVAAALLYRAVGMDLTCVFVDHGLLRKGEAELVRKTFREEWGMDLVCVDAKERFLRKLKGVTQPGVTPRYFISRGSEAKLSLP